MAQTVAEARLIWPQPSGERVLAWNFAADAGDSPEETDGEPDDR